MTGDLVVDERTGQLVEVGSGLRDRQPIALVDEGATPDFGDGASAGSRPDLLRDPPESDLDGDSVSEVDASGDTTGATGAGGGDDQLVVDMDVDTGDGQRMVMQTRQEMRQPETQGSGRTQFDDTQLDVEAVRRTEFQRPRTEAELMAGDMAPDLGQEFGFDSDLGFETDAATDEMFAFDQEFGLGQEFAFDQRVEVRQEQPQEFGFEQEQALETESQQETRTEQRFEYDGTGRVRSDREWLGNLDEEVGGEDDLGFTEEQYVADIAGVDDLLFGED